MTNESITAASLLDLSGRQISTPQVLSGNSTSKIVSISTLGLFPGVYLLQIKSSEHDRFVKIVVQ